MKVYSMFSGVGGFEKGMLDVDDTVKFIGYSEINKYANMIYKYHYSDHKNYGDATKIDPDELPDFDMLCGGFPCQSFSIAGKRGGIEYDTRGTLYREIERVIKSKRPKIVFLENVKGLLSSKEGWDLYVILDSMVQCGYNIEWQVFNTKDYLPQNRERIFIIGYTGEESGQKIFPIQKDDRIYDRKAESGRRQSQTEDHTTTIRNNPMKADATFVNCLTHGGKSAGLHADMTLIADYRNDEGLRIRKDNNSPTLNADCHRDHNTNKHLTKCPPLIIHNTQPKDPISKNDGAVYAIDTKNRNAVEVQNGIKIDSKIRRLTPVECERLQGFSDFKNGYWLDNWTKYGINDKGEKILISDSQRYKCLGNAVSTPVISVIYKRLKEVFNL